MTYLHLKRHVSYGMIAGQAVFLDLLGDRYVALDPVAQADLLALRAGDEPVPAEGGARDRLLATGLFQQFGDVSGFGHRHVSTDIATKSLPIWPRKIGKKTKK